MSGETYSDRLAPPPARMLIQSSHRLAIPIRGSLLRRSAVWNGFLCMSSFPSISLEFVLLMNRLADHHVL
jgi:hypothetical protein